MKQIRYIGKTLKQDETVRSPWSVFVTKHGETKCNNETDTFLSQEISFFYKPISVLLQTKRLGYIGKTLKQDETDQKTCSKLVTKQGEMKWNDETYIFFFINPFLFRNQWNKIYRKISETGWNRPKNLKYAHYESEFQSILEYSLYILIVSSVSVMEKKTCPKETCMVFVQYMWNKEICYYLHFEHFQ